MAIQVAPVMASLVEALNAAGVRASVDLGQVNPPAVWVVPESIDQWTGCAAQLQVALYAAVPDQGEAGAVSALDGLLGRLLDALDGLSLPYGTEPIRAQRIATSNGGPELPAWRVVTQLTV